MQENKNGRKLIDFPVERGMFGGDTFSDHKSIHMYTRIGVCSDGIEVKRMINLVLMKR